MKKILLTLLLVPSLALANLINEQCPEHVWSGAPVSSLPSDSTQYICRTNYAVHYRYDTKTAEYVVEHVTLADVTGPARRRDNFRADPAVPAEHQAVLEDYVGSGYDRGHLSPAATNTENDLIMGESFFLSNMVPQVPNHNRGIWRILELKIRSWVRAGTELYVVTGTAYAPDAASVGPNQVGVPTHMWKVIVDRTNNRGIGFFLPNTAIPVKNLPQYIVSISEIEQLTGIDFHPDLPADLSSIETAVDPAAWPGLQ
jgi:endonuclease G